MGVPMAEQQVTFGALEAREQALGSEFWRDNGNLALRVHRAIRWGMRGDSETGDDDAAFIFYWIAFNAAYAEDRAENSEETERAIFGEYLHKVAWLDTERIIHTALWNKFSGPVRMLLENRYVHNLFWKHQNGVPGNEDWEYRFNQDKSAAQRALGRGDTDWVLKILFSRLYVLRNQLIHGGSTWNSSLNRDQARDGARIMAFLVPLFVSLMLDNPEREWGAPYYPPVDGSGTPMP